MSVTIHRPVYTGTGYRAMNGSGLALTLEQEVESLEQAIYDIVADIRAVLGGPGSTITQQIAQATAQGDTTLQYARAALFITIASAAGMATGEFPGALSAAIDTALTLAAVDVAAGQLAEPAGYQVAQIGSGATPVTPVTPPPAGYGGASESDIADAIWGYLLTTTNAKGQNHNMLAGNILGFLGTLANIYGGSDGQGDIRTPWFRWVSDDSSYMCSPNWLYRLSPFDAVPILDFSLVQAGDTVLSYLTREYGDWDWTTTNPAGEANSGRVWALVMESTPSVWLRCSLTDQELHHLTTTTTTAAGGAPVWPGIANVTLGEAVPFNDVIEVDGPMDGVLVAYTTPPSKVSIYNFGSYTAYGRAGQIAFVSDNGQVEEEQWLQFSQALYTPKAMSRAASCLVRPIAGQEGTITPWTVT